MNNKLKYLRKTNGLTIYDISKKIGISSVHYYMIESGKSKLYYDIAIKISSVFNMKPDDIFYTN